MGPRDSFRHAPNATTIIAGSLILLRSPWDAHSLILCSARSALMALCRRCGGWSTPAPPIARANLAYRTGEAGDAAPEAL